jgi:hypothetical protein
VHAVKVTMYNIVSENFNFLAKTKIPKINMGIKLIQYRENPVPAKTYPINVLKADMIIIFVRSFFHTKNQPITIGIIIAILKNQFLKPVIGKKTVTKAGIPLILETS